ncbi:MAG: carbon-nitrogen hydrolase family protein [Chloroflexi bacterium]|nr:carbon-nitrogen hydrolase family protein [Chloroflexota bacterium]
MGQRVRIATTQYEVGDDREANLLALLRWIDAAAATGADLVLFPEFANHPSAYRDQEHCWEVAVDPEGPWVGAIRERARQRGIWVAFNASTRGPRPAVYGQSYLIDRTGTVVATVRKKVLIGAENDFITRDDREPEVIATELGRIGFVTCMDGVLPETARTVALKGAQIVLDSLSSNARDEGALHVPTRAVENHVFMVSSCKSGPLVPLHWPAEMWRRVPMAEHLRHAPGESQIVHPSGRVLAKGGWRVEGIVYADIDPSEADDKHIPGEGDLLADRRPDLYGLLALPTESLPANVSPNTTAVEPFFAAALQTVCDPNPEYAVLRGLDVSEEAADRGARLIVLPELYPFLPGAVAADPARAAQVSREVLQRLTALAAAREVMVVTSLVEEEAGRYFHTVWLIGPSGELGRYRQVHLRQPDRAWATPGDRWVTVDTPLGRIGLLAGYDGLFLESARCLACLGADLIAYPACWRVEWEPRLALRERAAENHLTILAANRADSPVARGAIIATVPRFPVPWRGRLNPVEVAESSPALETFILQRVDPVASRNKQMVPKTDALRSRRVELHAPLVAPQPAPRP